MTTNSNGNNDNYNISVLKLYNKNEYISKHSEFEFKLVACMRREREEIIRFTLNLIILLCVFRFVERITWFNDVSWMHVRVDQVGNTL
jgi:hypothetical protein